jgi:hypothetical protein
MKVICCWKCYGSEYMVKMGSQGSYIFGRVASRRIYADYQGRGSDSLGLFGTSLNRLSRLDHVIIDLSHISMVKFPLQNWRLRIS